MKNQKILRNAFITFSVLLALIPLLTAGARDGARSLGTRPFVPRRPTFITFGAPGAVNGTFPSAINPAGVITGYFNDENFVSHGFVRAQHGTIAAFDVPGAVNGTFPSAINPAGGVIGISSVENFLAHGCLIAQNGNI